MCNKIIQTMILKQQQYYNKLNSKKHNYIDYIFWVGEGVGNYANVERETGGRGKIDEKERGVGGVYCLGSLLYDANEYLFLSDREGVGVEVEEGGIMTKQTQWTREWK